MFSSVFSVAGNDVGRNRQMQLINTCLCDWCHCQNLWVFDNGMVYMIPGLLATDGMHRCQRGKRIFTQVLAGVIKRALN